MPKRLTFNVLFNFKKHYLCSFPFKKGFIRFFTNLMAFMAYLINKKHPYKKHDDAQNLPHAK